MNNDFKSPAFKKLLDSLQQQSWELELIISGFSIYGLFTAYEPLKIGVSSAEYNDQIHVFVMFLVAYTACAILLFNLLLHVILRGLWIGALGLRYVSGDIEFDKLKYSDKFKNFLKKRIVSFDRFIGNLENYCSVLFAISFLLIFYVLAITVVNLSIVLTANYILNQESWPEWLRVAIGLPIILFIVIGMLLTFIDFISQGYLLKRNKWVSKIYFPFYWVFGYLTLSFLYRPLVYNFLDNRFGKRLIMLLIPIYIVILVLTTFYYRTSNFLDDDLSSSATFANKENYLDMLNNEGDFPGEMIIPSKVISTNYLQVFLPFKENIDDRVFAYNDSLKPKVDRRGLTSSINITTNWNDEITNIRQKDSIRQMYLRTFNRMYFFEIDSVKKDGEFVLTTNEKDIFGFETVLDLDSIKSGKHLIKLKRKRIRQEKEEIVTQESVPFWYFKE